MRVETKKREKLSKNNKKYIEEKQNTILQFRTLTHHRNRRIRLHHKNDTSVERRTNNVQIKDDESNGTELRNLRKRNDDYHLND